MNQDYEPSPEQREAIQSAVDAALMPLIRRVLVKKIGQAAMFLKEEIDARYVPLSDDKINELWMFYGQTYEGFARAIERHVRGDHAPT